MADLVEQENHNETLTSCIIQDKASQDFATTYISTNGARWLIAFDGHGSHTKYNTKKINNVVYHNYVDWLKKLDWKSLIETHSLKLLEKVQELSDTWSSTESIGACIVIARLLQR